MSVYSISLFLHIFGALGLFAALCLEWAGLVNLGRVTEASQAREWIRLLATPRRFGGPAALLLLATGIYMAATRWGLRGWIVVSLAAMAIIAVLAGAVSGRRVGAIARALPVESGSMSAVLRRQLHDPLLALSIRLRTALFLGIVFLMSIEPGTAGSLAAIGVAAVAGLVAAVPARRGESGAARVAGSVG